VDQSRLRELADQATVRLLNKPDTVDPVKKRATIFGWISNACQGAGFTAFGFYLPVILVVAGVGVSSSGNITGTNLVTALIYVLATISGFIAPLMLPRIGHRGLAMSSWLRAC
jgi:hypothetical protein